MVSRPSSPTRVKHSTLNTSLSTSQPHTTLPHTNQYMHQNTNTLIIHADT